MILYCKLIISIGKQKLGVCVNTVGWEKEKDGEKMLPQILEAYKYVSFYISAENDEEHFLW